MAAQDKTTLQTAITAFTNGGNNSASEFRTFMTDFLDTVYPTPIDEVSSDPLYTTPTDAADFPYFVKFTKQGRCVNVQGYVSNISGVSAPNEIIFTFPATVGGDPNPLLPDDTDDPDTTTPFVFRGEGVKTNDGTRVNILIWDDGGSPKMRISGAFPSGGDTLSENHKFRFNFTYLVKE